MSPQLAFPGPNEVPGFAVPLHRSLTEPILLGGGKRLFPDDGSARGLELVSATTTAPVVPESAQAMSINSCRPRDKVTMRPRRSRM